jgi:flagellar hook-associated protein 2
MSDLIDGLVAAERLPIRALEQRQSATNQRISTLGDLVSKLKALQAKAKELDSTSELKARSVTSSQESRVTSTITGEATPGPHSVRVISLAAAQIDRSIAMPTNQAPGTGYFDIQVGTDDPVGIGFDPTMSLDDVARQINDSGARVKASVVDDGSGFRLVVTAEEPGVANAVSFTETGGMSLGFDGTSLVRAASDASIELDGLPVTRTTNTITDLVPGLTLDLHSQQPLGEPAAVVTVSENPEGLREKMAGFVEAYNEVAKLIKRELTKTGEGDVSKGQMLGDSTLRSLQKKLGSIATSAFSHNGDTLALGSVGITFAGDGTLSVDDTKFDAVYKADPDAIGNLFAGGSGSLTSQLFDLVDDYTESGTGILTAKKEGLESRIDDYEKQVSRIEARATELGDRLRQTFTALDQTVSALQQQQQQLLSLFGGLS